MNSLIQKRLVRASVMLFLFFLVGILKAQTSPQWVDADYRAREFSSRQFLTGYSEQSNVSKKESADVLEKLVDIAKGSLIEKVEVEVKSVSTAQISDANGEIDDFFSNTVKSSSSLKLAGLQVDKYYDASHKRAYAFAYVDRFKLALYYSDIIEKNIEAIESVLRRSKAVDLKSNIKERYRLITGVWPLFAEISTAQRVLIAIGEAGQEHLQNKRINETQARTGAALNEVRNHPDMTIDDLGFILGYTFLKEVNAKPNTLSANEVTFEETGLTSDFSSRLLESMMQSLAISKTDETDKKEFLITGNYWVKGSRVEVKCALLQHSDGKLLAKSAGSIALRYLEERNVSYISPDVERIRLLPEMNVRPINNNLTGKAGSGIDDLLKVEVRVNGQPAPHIPIAFYNASDSTVYCRVLSDGGGLATCKVKRISGKYTNQVIKAGIDLDTYLQIEPANTYYQSTVKNIQIPTAKFVVKVSPATVAFKVTETNFDSQNDVLLIEPKIKQQLAAEGFMFTTDPAIADFVIHLTAASRKGGSVSGLFFAYVDVNVSVYNNALGKEIYKENFENIKGGGGSFQQAGAKAFYKAADFVTTEVVKAMVRK